MTMEIIWEEIHDASMIDAWMSERDKTNLCMQKKNWQETAFDIEECLKFMKKSAFVNKLGYIEGEPALAIMFGIENKGTILNLYNIIVAPRFRNQGICKKTLKMLLSDNSKLNIPSSVQQITVSALPENDAISHIMAELNFSPMGKNDEFNVFKKHRNNEPTLAM